MSRRLIPLFNRVLVKRIKNVGELKIGGVLLPEVKAKELRNNEAIVIEVGPGTEKYMPVLKKNDKVILPDYEGQSVKFEGEKYELYRDDEIIGIIEEHK